MIKDRLGQAIYGTNTYHLRHVEKKLAPNQHLTYAFEFNANVGPGSYSIAIALHASDTHVHRNFEWRDLAALFTVINQHQSYFVGSAWLPPKLKCMR
jgi:lipopolysaccharide transport system ATP-binding protein